MFGKGPVTEIKVGAGLSVDVSGLLDVGAEVYAFLWPGSVVSSSRQGIVLAGGEYRHMVWERVREDVRWSMPEGADGSMASCWECDEDELPFVSCANAGATVWLPRAICEACGVGEGSTLLARGGAHGALWLYPQGAGDAGHPEGAS